MIKYLFFITSLLTLFCTQLDYFYKIEIKKCKIENTSEINFIIGKRFSHK